MIMRSTANERLHSLIDEYRGIDHVLQCIADLDESDRIHELSSLYLESASGWSYSKVREILIILESFGVLNVEKGKYISLTTSLKTLSATDEDTFHIVRHHIQNDADAMKLIKYIASEYEVGDKLEGERAFKVEAEIGREKIREIFLRLECAGFVLREEKKKRVLLRSLDELL